VVLLMMKRIWRPIVSYIQRTDKLLFLTCLMLSFFSLILLFGISRSRFIDFGGGEVPLTFVTQRGFMVQCTAVLIGVIAAMIISLVDYKNILRWWKLHVPFTYPLVMSTFFVGFAVPERPDAKRWLKIPIINFSLRNCIICYPRF